MSSSSKNAKSISGNGRKKILVIGKTGTGKSTLCNVLSGKKYDADYFKTSSEGKSCTQKPKFKDVFLNGDEKKPVSLIDTMGFDDPTKNHDAKIIGKLVVKLKKRCDYVNLFVLAVNGQNPRLDGSLLTMIRILEGMFGKQFWNQTVLVFTRMPMSLRDKERREKINKKTDAQLAADFIKIAEEQFGDCSGLRYLYMDAIYEKDDDDEKAAFDSACTKLYEMLEELPGLSTENVKKVATDNALLQRKIKEQEKEMRKIKKVVAAAVVGGSAGALILAPLAAPIAAAGTIGVAGVVGAEAIWTTGVIMAGGIAGAAGAAKGALYSTGDGNETDGNETDGNETDGNETDGSETDGNETDGNETDGNETDG
ncbi:uncharacterized protein LOC111718251 [Eurytemora carolleeae]|uniref:uncharacterized protein LOC111718251 n=1 Tax=Eurytemora carolleeae TaxID=1294199 RepID=UPI000C762F09|nr:uncharacterized protein LOC111718251 [Eurytemora carolleeae]|eukprot:XP_023349562.1 uncharacterized protein LOC111718251 [Eurytemora affinis]